MAQKIMNEKKKKKASRKDRAAIVLNNTDPLPMLKKRRRLRARQESELLSEEAPSEKEKQSLRAWVERWMKPQKLHGPFCNGDTPAATFDKGTSDFSPCRRAFEVDLESHGYGEKPLSNVPNGQANHPTQRCSTKDLNVRSSEVSVACCLASTHAHPGSLLGEIECSSLAIAKLAYVESSSDEHARSGKDHLSSCQAPDGEFSHSSSSLKGNALSNKRKRGDDKVLQYVLKRNVVIHPSLSAPLPKRSRTAKSVVDAWGRSIPVTLTSDSCTVEDWISSQKGSLFGLDVEWRPNRARGEKNKVALLQLCNESECLIIQMLFLNHKPQALRKLLSDPSKSLAGVGVLADGKRLLHDYGLECQGGIELTTLAVDRLKRDELRNAGLKVLMQEVLGLKMHKPKRVTLSNWAKVELNTAQISYACMDAWASFALSQKLLADV